MWWFKSAEQMIAVFIQGRTPQSDEAFLTECGLPDDDESQRIALAVRKAVASAGSVDPAYIRASDRYPENLITLPGWDSLDFLDWVFRLERELGMKLPRQAFASIRVPFSVRELVYAAYEYLSRRPTI